MDDASKIVVAVIGVLIIVALMLGAPTNILYLGFLTGPEPPKPEITYGEFPFTLVYERNGEKITVNDTLICKFDGFNVTSNGKVRKWKRSYASGSTRIYLWEDKELKLYYEPDSTEYYMGISDYSYEITSIAYNKGTKYGYYDEREAFEKFGIKIISWEIAPPIENSLK